MRPMKANRYYLLSILVIMLNVMTFNVYPPMFVDNTSETKVEVTLEEKESVNEWIANVSVLHLREIKISTSFYCPIPILSQLSLNNIFRPPISLHA